MELESNGQLNFFRAFRFDINDSDRLVLEIIEFKNRDRSEKVISEDFSLSGIGVISRKKFDVGAEVVLKIFFKKTRYEIYGTIIRGSFDQKLDYYQFGIHFQQRSSADVLSLMDKYLVGLSSKRLKNNITKALQEASGRFSQPPEQIDMIIYLLNSTYLQGGVEAIFSDAFSYLKEIGMVSAESTLRESVPYEKNFSARLSDFYDCPKYDIFSVKKVNIVVIEILRGLFHSGYQRFVGFNDPSKAREYALIGKSKKIAGFRSKILDLIAKPSCILITGPTGSGKSHFSNILREELRKKNTRSKVINPTIDFDINRYFESNESFENELFIFDNVKSLKGEQVSKLNSLSKNNWVIINSIENLELGTLNLDYKLELDNLNLRQDDIGALCQYYLHKRHSLHFQLEESFIQSFSSLSFERGVWQLFEMLDTFVFNMNHREAIVWPDESLYPEFMHDDHKMLDFISSEIDFQLTQDKSKEEIVENLLSNYLLQYVERFGAESLTREHRELLDFLKQKVA